MSGSISRTPFERVACGRDLDVAHQEIHETIFPFPVRTLPVKRHFVAIRHVVQGRRPVRRLRVRYFMQSGAMCLKYRTHTT